MVSRDSTLESLTPSVNAPSKPMASSPFTPKTIIHRHCITTTPTYYPKTFEHLDLFLLDHTPSTKRYEQDICQKIWCKASNQWAK